jgi:glycosyltransferase involved in cell wall biosynthesis
MKYKESISVVIPIYNESELLEKEIQRLITQLQKVYRYEIILIENGSKDNTYAIAKKLASQHKTVSVLQLQTPCYGAALQKGILHAQYPVTVQFDLDLIDVTFLRNAVALLEVNDVVVGSKMLPGSHDGRAPARYIASFFTNFLLRALLGYKGTDTHGIKAYKTDAIARITRKLQPTHLFFDTEILLIAQKQQLRIVELPVEIHNLRPSRFNTRIIVSQLVREFMRLLRRKHQFENTETHKLSITADDYGLNPLVNTTIAGLITKKHIQTVSILPNMPFHTIRKPIDKAVHINVIEGKPVLPPEKIPTLVQKDGTFYPFVLFYLRLCLNMIRFEELYAEISAQIARVKKSYGTVRELNSHQHTHTLFPLDRIVTSLAIKYSIRDFRIYGNVHTHSMRGVCMYTLLVFLVFVEHAVFGHIFRTSPVWKRGKKSISFLSWENSISNTVSTDELVCHPGTSYDHTVYTSILR